MQQITPVPNASNDVRKKKRNKHEKKLIKLRNQEQLNSVTNALLVAALLIISGLASGHYIGSHSHSFNSSVVSTSTLNRYVNRSIEIYQQLLQENAELRQKLSSLEYNLGVSKTGIEDPEQFQKGVLKEFMTFVDKEIHQLMKIVQELEHTECSLNEIGKIEETPENEDIQQKVESLIAADSGKGIPSSTDFRTQTLNLDNMVDDSKPLQRRLKKKNVKKDEKEENIAKGEKIKNIQDELLKGLKGEETLEKKKERALDNLADADIIIASCESCTNEPVAEYFHLTPSQTSMDHTPIASYDSYGASQNNKGYVYNIRKLFEPHEQESCPILENPNMVTELASENPNKATEDVSENPKMSEQTSEKINGDKKTVVDAESVSINTNSFIIGPMPEADEKELEETRLQKSYDDAYNLQFVNDKKADIRESKSRKMKNRSNEGNTRAKRKMKHNRCANPFDDFM